MVKELKEQETDGTHKNVTVLLFAQEKKPKKYTKNILPSKRERDRDRERERERKMKTI